MRESRKKAMQRRAEEALVLDVAAIVEAVETMLKVPAELLVAARQEAVSVQSRAEQTFAAAAQNAVGMFTETREDLGSREQAAVLLLLRDALLAESARDGISCLSYDALTGAFSAAAVGRTPVGRTSEPVDQRSATKRGQ